MSGRPTLSVVICFRDWGLDRLRLAIQSHKRSTLGDDLEVVVSDYGSQDADAVRAAVEAEGGRVTRTNTEKPWSRSRALNAGVVAALSDRLITTDADILFSTDAHRVVYDTISDVPNAVHLIQCKDLPPQLAANQIRCFDWDAFELNSTFRPRWGMGGMAAFHRHLFNRVRGYEARMEIYGAEDIDFAQRLQRTGAPLNWITQQPARIYHIWHPSSRDRARRSSQEAERVAQNRRILLEDATNIRNYHPETPIQAETPAASIIIATHNRAHYLSDSIRSCLRQTVRDFELLVVDDGSDDETASVAQNFAHDSRVRYIKLPRGGASRARNVGVAHARADNIVVQDDDDIMLPRRLELHLDHLMSGSHGTYGGWIDFDNVTGELTPNQGAEFSYDALLFRAKTIVHGASMLPKKLLQRFPYREDLRAGIDYNLFIRLAKAGLKMTHTRRMHILRRVHPGSLTQNTAAVQTESAHRTTRIVLSGWSRGYQQRRRERGRAARTVGCVDLTAHQTLYQKHLPAHLVHHRIQVEGLRRADVADELASTTSHHTDWTFAADFSSLLRREHYTVRSGPIEQLEHAEEIADELRALGYRAHVLTERALVAPPKARDDHDDALPSLDDCVSALIAEVTPGAKGQRIPFVVVTGPFANDDATREAMSPLNANGTRFVPIVCRTDRVEVPLLAAAVETAAEAAAAAGRIALSGCDVVTLAASPGGE